MNEFKNVYQSAVHDMKEFHIDVSDCMNEGRHTRRVIKRTGRIVGTAFSAMCVVFVCGLGTVKAADYIHNVIKVNKWGFESADIVTMARNEAGGCKTFLIGEEVEMALAEDTLTDTLPAGAEAERKVKEMYSLEIEETEDMAIQDSTSSRNSFSSGSGEDLKAMAESVTGNSVSGNEQPEVPEIPVYNYSSWEEFEKNEDIIFPQPSISIGENIGAMNITVCGDWAMACYDVDGKVLWIERTDYADTQGHESSKVFPGGVYNERQYVTKQGYTYILVDSVKESGGEPQQIHAAVTAGSYEIFVDFMGFTEKEAEKILDSIDLSLYE